jgi:hypothetical protein
MLSVSASTRPYSHPQGVLFLQSTDASGVACKNAEYLQQDINKAIDLVGKQNVFIVCMDEACSKLSTLRSSDSAVPLMMQSTICRHWKTVPGAD